MSTTHIRVGEIHKSNKSGEFKIIEFFNARNVTIQFNDGFIVKNKTYGQIKVGKVVNPYHPWIYNTGFIGEGKFSSTTHNKFYHIWRSMLRRCYDEKTQIVNYTYTICNVDKRWHNFQIFCVWCETNYIDGFYLDKDILFKGNKVYGPDTCCFVPVEINNLFKTQDKYDKNLPTGINLVGNKFKAKLNRFGNTIYLGTFDTKLEAFKTYKILKEEYIKEVANLWKPKLKPEVYEAMINYQVEITD